MKSGLRKYFDSCQGSGDLSLGSSCLCGDCMCGLDIVESDKDYVVRADLPGLKKNEISVFTSENILHIEAERKREERGEGEKVKWEERYHGKISRRIRLHPACDVAKVKTSFEDGVLTLTFPKGAELDTRKKIEL